MAPRRQIFLPDVLQSGRKWIGSQDSQIVNESNSFGLLGSNSKFAIQFE